MADKIESKCPDSNEPSDFEGAISATGYGKFNILLLLIAIPCCVSTVFETSTMSFVVPSAECDLHLSLMDKGNINAVTYGGMITSAIFWGYLADLFGRRRLLIGGYSLNATCVFLSALSQRKWVLMIAKFFGGFIICGPFAVLVSYFSEFHGLKHRPRLMMFIGTFFSIATCLLPGIAFLIIPRQIDFNFMSGIGLQFHSWQLFIAVCAMPSAFSAICVTFLPESPKFLMTMGRNTEALVVFRKIFAINTGRDRDEYPVNKLFEERTQQIVPEKGSEESHLTLLQMLKDGLSQMAPLFRKPYLGNFCLGVLIQFGCLYGLNTVRLWIPQLFAMIMDYEQNVAGAQDEKVNLCDMISYTVNKSMQMFENDEPLSFRENCVVHVASGMYLNASIIGFVSMGLYFVAGALINACGNKNTLIFSLMTSGLAGILLYWASNSTITLVFSSIYVSVGSIASTALLSAIVNLFPTTLRTTTVSLVMMFGRTGALIGNVVFPYLLEIGCLPSFLMIGLIMIVCGLLCIILPDTKKLSLV